MFRDLQILRAQGASTEEMFHASQAVRTAHSFQTRFEKLLRTRCRSTLSQNGLSQNGYGPPGTIPKSVIKCIIHSITLIATIAITPRSTLELHVNNNCSTPFSALRQSTAMPPLRGCTPRDKNCATNATAERRSDPAHSKRPTLCYRCNCPKAIISGALQERQKKRYR